MVAMLLDEQALRKRIFTLHSNQQQKAKPRYYKSGRRKGQLMRPGLQRLPYTAEDLWQHVLKQIGPGCILCPYCTEIRRPATAIDLQNCVLDHHVPMDKSMSAEDLERIHCLSNIVACCEECNTLKGRLSYAFFIDLMRLAESPTTLPSDRASLYACLKTHGKVMRGWKDKAKNPAPTEDVTESPLLALSGQVKGLSKPVEDW